jgi:chromatin remodeling complex protein RSC6
LLLIRIKFTIFVQIIQKCKKIWDYIKANGLQDATNKRAINADAKLKPVFGKDQVTMFELAGIAGKHLRPVGE